MIAFEVHHNGKKLCTAGIGDQGVLSSDVSWAGGPELQNLHMHVGGLDTRTQEHKSWSVPVVGLGDEITTRIIEAEEVDPPVESRTQDSMRRSLPRSFRAIGAELILLDAESRRWESQGLMDFVVLPRIGEWVELDLEGVPTMTRIVMVAHQDGSDRELRLHAVVEGRTADCLKRLSESS